VLPLATERAEILALAAALEQGSEHPLARAILTEPEAAGVSAASDFEAHPGYGVSGRVGERVLRLGAPAWVLGDAEETHPGHSVQHPEQYPEQYLEITRLQEEGKTVVALAEAGETPRLLGLIAIADPLRPSTPAAIARLIEKGVRPVMLTGDNPRTARAIARQAGIEEFQAGILPEGKVRAVLELKQKGVQVGMVGDGINDAPALAAADVSFAMGAGSDAAIKTADVTLMRNDLQALADALDLSHATLNKIRQNLFFAFIYNVLGIPLAALGFLNPVLAGAAMALSSVSVVSNSLRLKSWRPRR